MGRQRKDLGANYVNIVASTYVPPAQYSKAQQDYSANLSARRPSENRKKSQNFELLVNDEALEDDEIE
jgi:hypothetical protein